VVGRVVTATGAVSGIPHKVLYSLGLPAIGRISGTKKPQWFRNAVLPAC